jgi:hypothetical protein
MTSYSLIASIELWYRGILDKVTPPELNDFILAKPGRAVPVCSFEGGMNKISYKFASPILIKGVKCAQVNSIIVNKVKITETKKLE